MAGPAEVTIRFDDAALERLFNDVDGDIAKDLARRAIKVDAAAKRLVPVDTGRLRSSINWRIARDNVGLHAIIGTNVDYALHVEFGTRFMSARPYLRPALAAGR